MENLKLFYMLDYKAWITKPLLEKDESPRKVSHVVEESK